MSVTYITPNTSEHNEVCKYFFHNVGKNDSVHLCCDTDGYILYHVKYNDLVYTVTVYISGIEVNRHNWEYVR